MSTPGIALLAQWQIPDTIMQHRFIQQLLDCMALRTNEALVENPVFGTGNHQHPELYGWVGNVERHVDNKGYCYFLILSDTQGMLGAQNCDSIPFSRGTLVRMNDYVPHWVTEHQGSAVGLFIGAFESPQDQLAIEAFKKSLVELVNQNYYASPRYHDAPLQDDECYVMTENPREGANACAVDEHCYIKLKKDAIDDGDHIELCSHMGCQNTAIELDRLFPYYQDHNRCKQHQS